MGELPLHSLLEFALDAAWQAGRITLGYFQAGVTAERKADNSPVTIADRLAEQRLRELIGRYWPDHGIIGEELGCKAPAPLPPNLGGIEGAGGQAVAAGPTWILDPIDGTKSFMQGVPLYAVLVALADGDSSLVGVVHFPALGETVYAARGEGCYWNGRRAHVSTVSDLKNAVLLASEINTFGHYGRAEAWQRLMDATYIQRTWGDAYGYALVATGRAEIMVDPVTEVWDCGPLPVVLEEAGGTFTDWQGKRTIYGRESIATNGALFEKVMGLIAR